MFDLWQFTPYLLNRAGHRIAEAFGPELDAAGPGLSLSMWRVLATLRNDGAQRLGDLARLTTIETSTLSRLVGHMQQKGLVSRVRCGDDGRAVTVTLTDRGIDVTDRLIPVALEYERIALQGMSDAEIAILKRLLLVIYENMETLPTPEVPAD